MSADTTLQKENAALKQELHQLQTSGHSERFRTIFDYSRLANKIISPDLEIMEINIALVRLLGYSAKEDIIGTRILDYSPQEHHAHWRLLQEHLWQKQTPFFKLETSLIKKDGSVIWCQVTSILFPDKQVRWDIPLLKILPSNSYLNYIKRNLSAWPAMN